MGKYLEIVKNKKQKLTQLETEKEIKKTEIEISNKYLQELSIKINKIKNENQQLKFKYNSENDTIKKDEQELKIGLVKLIIIMILIISLMLIPLSLICSHIIFGAALEVIMITSILSSIFGVFAGKIIVPNMFKREKQQVENYENKINKNNAKLKQLYKTFQNASISNKKLIHENKLLEKQSDNLNIELTKLLQDLKKLLTDVSLNNNENKIINEENEISKK